MKTSGYANEVPGVENGDEARAIEALPELNQTVEAPPPWVDRAIAASTAEAIIRIRADRSRSLGITSALAGEGRTTIAIAAALAQRYDYGRKTLVVDLDLLNPGLSRKLTDGRGPGMAEYLRGTAALPHCIRWHDARLGVIPAGEVEDDAESLISAFLRMWALEQIGLLADVVVADLPALPPVGMGSRLASAFESLLLVVRAGVSSTLSINAALRSLPTTPPVIINRVERTGSFSRKRLSNLRRRTGWR